MTAIPSVMVTIKTVLRFPITGSAVIAFAGLNQSGCIISSKPKMEPKRNPNIVEKNPHLAIIPASLSFFVQAKILPKIKSTSPCPTSPNIKPNSME